MVDWRLLGNEDIGAENSTTIAYWSEKSQSCRPFISFGDVDGKPDDGDGHDNVVTGREEEETQVLYALLSGLSDLNSKANHGNDAA